MLSTSAGPPPEPWYFHGKTMRRMAYVLTGVGVLSAGAAVGDLPGEARAVRRLEDRQRRAPGGHEGLGRLPAQATSNNALASSLNSANQAIVGLSIAGGVLVAAGVTLFVVDLGAPPRERASSRSASATEMANVGWGWTW